ncbi:MAG: hypothetical protein RR636_03845 [Clostridium sp.]|uniref:hypothetical protein n=1 Tax=Clostridium sp. TaxID=1506 RepID=UPI003021B398
MKKDWKNPELKNLSVGNTEQGPTPYYWNPKYPECDEPTNTTGGYEICSNHKRPCKYFGVLGGGCPGECNAPSKVNPNKPS